MSIACSSIHLGNDLILSVPRPWRAALISLSVPVTTSPCHAPWWWVHTYTLLLLHQGRPQIHLHSVSCSEDIISFSKPRKHMGSHGLVVARAPAQISTLPYLIHPHLSLCTTVMMLVFWRLSGCFQGCLGPFGLGYCLSRGGFTRICRDAVLLVLAGFHTVPPYPINLQCISPLYLSTFP